MANVFVVGASRQRLLDELASPQQDRSIVVEGRFGDGVTTVLHHAYRLVLTSGQPARFIRLPAAGIAAPGDGGTWFIDNAHLADVDQVATIVEIALNTRVVLGVRPGAAPAELAWLWRSGWAELRSLEVMSHPDVATMIGARIGRTPHRGLVDFVTHRCGARPGFVADEVEDMIASGSITVAGLASGAALTPYAAERARALLAELPADIVQDVRRLAVMGALPAPCVDTTDIDVDELVRRHLVEKVGRGSSATIRLAPPMLAATVRSVLKPVMARVLALELETDLIRLLDPTDAVRLAILRGEQPQPADIIVAARLALHRNDVETALGLAAEARRLSSDGAFLEAQLLIEVGRRAEAADAYALIAADDSADPLARARAAVEHSLALLWDVGDPDGARRIAGQLADDLDGTPLAGLGRVHLAAVSMYLGEFGAAQRNLDDVEIAELNGLALGTAHMVETVTSAITDPASIKSTDSVRALIHRAPVQPGDDLDPWVRAISATLALELAGRVHDADRTLDTIRGELTGQSTPAGFGWMALAQARIDLAAGRARSALLSAEEAWDSFTIAGHPSGRRWAAAAALIADALLGDRAACAARLQQFEHLDDGVPFLDSDIARARAWAAWAIGDSRGAARQISGAIDLARGTHAVGLEVIALHDAYRLCRHDVTARLGVLAAQSPAPSVVLRHEHVRRAEAGDASGLIDVSASFEAMGSILLAADAAADAAALAGAAGLRSTRALADRHVTRLVESCEGAQTPLLGERGPARLTQREREVVLLAADGLASREIAVRIGISVRTVDNLLYRAYGKLDVHRRQDLDQVGSTLRE